MARFLVVGAGGMLGTDVVLALVQRGHEVLAPDEHEFDITHAESSAQLAVGAFGTLDAVVNLAAYTAVDAAEHDIDKAYGANALGPGLLGRGAAMAGVRVVHISTDYVFDGGKGSAYTEDDPTNPLGIYGKSKRDGEEGLRASGADAVILRTSWLYGPHGKSFPRSILAAARAGKSLRVVSDQYGTPTYTADLAEVIADVLEKPDLPAGVYHAAGPDVVSWFEVAKAVLAAAGLDVPVEAIATADWPTDAPRPAFSALDSSKLMGHGIGIRRHLDESLAEFVQRLV